MNPNNLRVLEETVNASDKLIDADKFGLQQYITRCYGSLTTFNIVGTVFFHDVTAGK